jgi:hypothetical protein
MFPNCGEPSLEGTRVVCVKAIFLLNEIWAQDKIYIFVENLPGSNILFNTYQLVPALAPNSKQHILSPVKVRKECHYSAELHVKSVYLNLFRGGGVKSMDYLYKGGASYTFWALWTR